MFDVIGLLAVFVLVVLAIVYCISDPLQNRWDTRRIFKKYAVEPADTQAVCQELAAINQRCCDFTFTYERTADIALEGAKITLIWGSLSADGPLDFHRMSSSASCLYALAKSDNIEYIENRSDIFTLIWKASPVSVFRVNVPLLEAALEGQQAGKQAG